MFDINIKPYSQQCNECKRLIVDGFKSWGTDKPLNLFEFGTVGVDSMKKRYCVRVVQTMTSVGIDSHDLVSFVECLSYAGLVTEHPIDSNGLTTLCFDIEAPPETDSKIWSEMNAERMRSFGYNAVSAPSTRRH